MNDNPFPANTYGWFAHIDFIHLKFLFEHSKEKSFYESILVLCHQFTEKILKHYIQSEGEIPSTTHSLKKLLSECLSLDKTFKEIRPEVYQLTTFYFDKRNPGENFYISDTEEVIESIVNTDTVKDFMYDKLLK